MLKLKALKKDNAYRIERVAVLADAKLMRVDCDGKETFIYSDANGVVELRHMHDLVVKENGEESNSSGTEQVQDDV